MYFFFLWETIFRDTKVFLDVFVSFEIIFIAIVTIQLDQENYIKWWNKDEKCMGKYKKNRLPVEYWPWLDVRSVVSRLRFFNSGTERTFSALSQQTKEITLLVKKTLWNNHWRTVWKWKKKIKEMGHHILFHSLVAQNMWKQ